MLLRRLKRVLEEVGFVRGLKVKILKYFIKYRVTAQSENTLQ